MTDNRFNNVVKTRKILKSNSRKPIFENRSVESADCKLQTANRKIQTKGKIQTTDRRRLN